MCISSTMLLEQLISDKGLCSMRGKSSYSSFGSNPRLNMKFWHQTSVSALMPV